MRMWPFSKSYSLEKSGFFKGFTDYHSHILPGVDDGIQTLEESLRVLDSYERLGIKTVWLTPHIMEDIPNTTEYLRRQFRELKSAYHGNISLHLASENMLDNLFEERLEKDDLLTMGERNNLLLVETSYYNPPINLYDLLERIKSRGYYPVLAHPERYVYMVKREYRELKNRGVKFQLNLPSFAGAYGESIRKKAGWLLENHLYDFAGIDLHTPTISGLITNVVLSKNQLKELEYITRNADIIAY